uniref:Uncharacterized protein n=1 Tax=viral metagenome TaxID=1070528 RepID=A0A6C0IWU5_9ZZZZ
MYDNGNIENSVSKKLIRRLPIKKDISKLKTEPDLV